MSSQGNKFQKWRYLFFLMIGLFLTVCLGFLQNAISLPPWMVPIIPSLMIAVFALLILVETIKEDGNAPTNQGRRAFFNRLILPASIIIVSTAGIIFSTLKDANANKEREQLEEERLAFDNQRKNQLTQLRIGLLPTGNNPGGKVNTSTFENSLANQLAIPVTSAYIGSTYTDTVNALAEGKIEVAWLGPLSYLYAHKKYGAKVILCQLRRAGQKTYQSYIIASAKTGIRTLQDLKGQTFAFVDPLSTSGNLVPRYMFKKAGLDPDKDIKGVYGISHEDVLQSVFSGAYPAGAVASDIYDLFEHKNDLVILAKSVDIPEGPIALRKDIQFYDMLRVEDAFLTIGENDPTILNTIGISGFAKATDDTYKGLLDIVEYLHIDLANYDG